MAKAEAIWAAALNKFSGLTTKFGFVPGCGLVLEFADPNDAGRTPKGSDFSGAIDMDPDRLVVVLMESLSGVVDRFPAM